MSAAAVINRVATLYGKRAASAPIMATLMSLGETHRYIPPLVLKTWSDAEPSWMLPSA